MSYYRIDRDGQDGLTLWRYDSPDEPPEPVLTRHPLISRDERWELAVRGAGLDPTYDLVDADAYDDLAGSNKWPAQPDDEATVDRVAHAIHDVHCGCDGSIHINTNPDLSPRMAQAAIRSLLDGGYQ